MLRLETKRVKKTRNKWHREEGLKLEMNWISKGNSVYLSNAA